jgi:hypothetical protein
MSLLQLAGQWIRIREQLLAEQEGTVGAVQQNMRQALLAVHQQLREDEHRPTKGLQQQQPAQSKARTSPADGNSSQAKRAKKAATPVPEAAASPQFTAELVSMTEAVRCARKLLVEVMEAAEESHAEAMALEASGVGTGIDVSQLDLASVFTLLLGSARAPDPESKQMKPAGVVCNRTLVASLLGTKACHS